MTSLSKDSAVRALPQVSGSPPIEAPTDPLRAMLATLIQETLEREFTQFVGAERFVRSPERRDVRNGHRRRRVTTRVGTIELRVPRDRAGRFQPSLFGRYQRSEQSLGLALTEMYFQGCTSRGARPGR